MGLAIYENGDALKDALNLNILLVIHQLLILDLRNGSRWLI